MQNSDFTSRLKQQAGIDAGAPSLRASFEGRFMAPDRREYSCRTIDMSTNFIVVRSEHAPEIGARIVLYLEECGRFEGTVTRRFNGGFTVNFEATHRKRERIAKQLAWLSRHNILDGAAAREYERVVPSRPASTFTLGEATFPCEIENISRKGAALKTAVKVQNGAKLTIGKGTKAEVVRQTEDGFAVQFLRLLPLELFDGKVEL